MTESLNGEAYYKAAVALTDKYPGTQFSEMLSHDSLVGPVERMYFRNEWRDLVPYGYNTFCLMMEESGQKRWLLKIKELDENIMLKHLEQQLMQASRDGKSPNRAMLESAVKALQGVSALSKVAAERGDLVSDGLEIRFIPSLNVPVEPEEWEHILAEKDPALRKYFKIGEPGQSKNHSLPSNAEGVTKGGE